jgi:hypothetical protein
VLITEKDPGTNPLADGCHIHLIQPVLKRRRSDSADMGSAPIDWNLLKVAQIDLAMGCDEAA